jgi:hypothetical protein
MDFTVKQAMAEDEKTRLSEEELMAQISVSSISSSRSFHWNSVSLLSHIF